MALTRPEPRGPLLGRTAPRRGVLAATACTETPRTGCPHAVVAAARCTPVQPFPGSGTDRHVRVRAGYDRAGRARHLPTARGGRGGRP
ncbi:hypothetical protein DMB38_03475 [Streptomyces sp. WAC 06738]|nr:hypothetical protein DMB38_03475 [Streptomyces sp. WAC 06738]